MSWGVAPGPPRSLSSSSLIRQASPLMGCRLRAEKRLTDMATRQPTQPCHQGPALLIFELGEFAGVERVEELANQVTLQRHIKRPANVQAFEVADDRIP